LGKKKDEEKKSPIIPVIIFALILGTIILGNEKAPKSHQ